jgi:hypothetical protein
MVQIKRLFIETDILKKSELGTAQNDVEMVLVKKGLPFHEDIFDEVKDFAWQQADAAWEAVKRADEIYGDSSLVPLCGYGTYTGAPVIMNVMMQKAIDEDIRGKSLIFLREFANIHWDQIDRKLLKKAFKYNKLFTYDWGADDFTPVNINELYKKLK